LIYFKEPNILTKKSSFNCKKNEKRTLCHLYCPKNAEKCIICHAKNALLNIFMLKNIFFAWKIWINDKKAVTLQRNSLS